MAGAWPNKAQPGNRATVLTLLRDSAEKGALSTYLTSARIKTASKLSFELAQSNNDIAVIGMACRFPGANNCRDYWRNLTAGRTFVQEIPPERWRWQDYWGDPESANRCNSKWGGFINDVDAFDRAFFGVSAREAETMDPQQRLGLELTWHCFEDAAIRPSKFSGRDVGVFVGVANLDYKEIIEEEQPMIDAHYATGIGSSVIANRISFYFNFRGPSVPLDTACSSSLFAIHVACSALRDKDCELAVAGGISLLLTPRRFICFSKAGMLSPSGAIRAFDDAADGMVRGEGGGLILLKPLANALTDGNKIVGIIKGSAVNHNGRTHSLTYPSVVAQADVISRAHQKARVKSSEVTYVEAHGTGTHKGDPIEFEGLCKAFRPDTASAQPAAGRCAIGTVKGNLGHLEAAAGIAGTIKVLLALQHKTLPPSINFNVLNTRISPNADGLYVVDQLQRWELKSNGNAKSRLAGVSSFGFAGTNAHVVLAEAPPTNQPKGVSVLWNVLLLSAKTAAALRRKQSELLGWLRSEGTQFSLSRICACLLHGREHFGVRFAAVVQTHQELVEVLANSTDGESGDRFANERLVAGETEQSEYRPSPDWRQSDARQLHDGQLRGYLTSFSQEYVKGLNPDCMNLYEAVEYSDVTLPAYPFERTRCWITPCAIKTRKGQAQLGVEAAAFLSDGAEKPRGIVLRPLTETMIAPDEKETSREPSSGSSTAQESLRSVADGPIVPAPDSTPATQGALKGVDRLLERVYQGDLEIDKAIESLNGFLR